VDHRKGRVQEGGYEQPQAFWYEDFLIDSYFELYAPHQYIFYIKANKERKHGDS
jgi:hypothetical protein